MGKHSMRVDRSTPYGDYIRFCCTNCSVRIEINRGVWYKIMVEGSNRLKVGLGTWHICHKGG